MSEPIAIQEIGQETAKKILDSCDGTGGKYEPLGLFFLQEGDRFVGHRQQRWECLDRGVPEQRKLSPVAVEKR